jgi:hypothetical protein
MRILHSVRLLLLLISTCMIHTEAADDSICLLQFFKNNENITCDNLSSSDICKVIHLHIVMGIPSDDGQ